MAVLERGHARPGGRAGAERARATRSATSRSRASTRPGRAGRRRARPGRPRPATGAIDEMVVRGGATLAGARGHAGAAVRTRNAAGPDLRELVVGSEGTLGVITEAALRCARARRCATTRAGRSRPSSRGRGLPRARAGAAPRPTSRGSPTRRRRAVTCAGRGRQPRRIGALPGARGLRGRLPARSRLRGHAGRVASARGAPSRCCGGGRRLARPRPGRGLGARALRRPVPARRPARPRRDGRDARDRHDLVQPARALRRGRRRAARRARSPRHAAGRAAATSPTSTPIGRVAVLHVHRPPGARATRSSSGARPRPRPCEAIVADGGTITHHHAVGRDHAPWLEAEVGPPGIGAAAGRQGRARPRRDHEPGEAAGLARAWCSAAAVPRQRRSGPAPGLALLRRLAGHDELAVGCERPLSASVVRAGEVARQLPADSCSSPPRVTKPRQLGLGRRGVQPHRVGAVLGRRGQFWPHDARPRWLPAGQPRRARRPRRLRAAAGVEVDLCKHRPAAGRRWSGPCAAAARRGGRVEAAVLVVWSRRSRR